jgi:hypothetical protein
MRTFGTKRITTISAAFALLFLILFAATAFADTAAGGSTDFNLEALDISAPVSNRIAVSADPATLQDAEAAGYKATFDNIQAAVDVAEPGDIIVVCPGTYQPFSIGESVSDIQIVGFDAKAVAADPNVTVVEINGASGITINSLELMHETPETCSAGCILIANSQDVSIIDCNLHGSGFYGILVNFSYRLVISGNLIHNCTDYALQVVNSPYEGNTSVDLLTAVLVEGNYFYENGTDLVTYESEYFDTEGFYSSNFFEKP